MLDPPVLVTIQNPSNSLQALKGVMSKAKSIPDIFVLKGGGGDIMIVVVFQSYLFWGKKHDLEICFVSFCREGDYLWCLLTDPNTRTA